MDAYASVYAAAKERQAKRRPTLGDPAASAEAVMQIVDAQDPPLRVFFGSRWLEQVTAEYERRLSV
jgi:hypothetical protein